jgi:hypothetical protein
MPTQPATSAALSTLVLVASLSACLSPRRVHTRPNQPIDGEGVTFMRYASSGVQGFISPSGLSCGPISGQVRDNLIGWESREKEDFACIHDTLEDGLAPASLELHWRVVVPENGRYELLPGGYALGGWGGVVSRGSSIGDYVAKANVIVEAVSPSCIGSWSMELAKAQVTGPFVRVAPFSGWITLPKIDLRGCRGGEALDVRVRLVGESNRGKIYVDWFGFSAFAQDEIDKIFAIRPRSPEASQPARLP